MLALTHEWLADFSGRWWPALANHLWQSTLFSLCVILSVAVMLRGAPARERYRAWLVASAKFACPLALAALTAAWLRVDLASLLKHAPEAPRRTLSVLQAAETVLRVAEPLAPPAGAPPPQHTEVYCVLTLVWAAGAAWLLGSWLSRRRRRSRALTRGMRAAGRREAEAFERARGRMKGLRGVRLALSEDLEEVGVWGALRPLVVLPAPLAGALGEEELEAVLLHELAHVKRRDNLVGNLHMILCCLLWFHPLVWLIDRRLIAERERACDEAVVRLGVARDVYAAGLLKAGRLCLGGEVAGLSKVAGSGLGKRVKWIMGVDYRNRARDRALLYALAACLLFVTVAGGLFSRASVFAESRFYRRLAEFPYELPAVRGQDPKARTRMRMGPRTEPNTPAPELYSDKLALQIMLINLPGAADPASYWEGSYQLYFVSEAEEKRVLDAKYKELAPNGGAVAFDTEPSDYKEKILLAEGRFKKAGLGALQDRTLRVEDISFKDRVPEAQRTQRGRLMTVYSVRVYDARLKAPIYRASEWVAPVFDDAAGVGGKLLPRSTLYANFFVSPKGDMFVSQWARDTKDTEW